MLQRHLGNLLYSIGSREDKYVGGTANALVGALAMSLMHLVFDLQTDKKKYSDHVDEIEDCKTQAHNLMKEFLSEAEIDAHVYEHVIIARQLPKQTDEEKEKRQEAIDRALVRASKPQMRLIDLAEESLTLVRAVAKLDIQGAIIADLKVCLVYLQAVIEATAVTAESNYSAIQDETLRVEEIDFLSDKVKMAKRKLNRFEEEVSFYLKERSWREEKMDDL